MIVSTRMASFNDIESLVKVRFDYFSAEKWEVSPEQHVIIETSIRQYYLKYLNSDFFAALTEVDDIIASVAFLAISHIPANFSFPTGKTGTIMNVLTYPEYRNKGYATSTMKLVIDEAKKQCLSYIELSSSESGKSLYKKLGFTESEPVINFTKMKLSLL